MDSSAKYLPSMSSSPTEVFHTHKSKTVSNPGKQNKTLSQTNKKFTTKISAAGFKNLNEQRIVTFKKTY